MDFITLLLLNLAAFAAGYLFLVSHIRKELNVRGIIEKLRNEVSALVIEINATTDRNITLIEDRLSTLKDFLKDTDRRLVVLDREINRRKNEQTVYNRLGKETILPSSNSDKSEEQKNTDHEFIQSQEHVISDIYQEKDKRKDLYSDANANSIPFVTFSKQGFDISPTLKERVEDLRKRGFSNDMIAAKLEKTIAEIEHIVNSYENYK